MNARVAMLTENETVKYRHALYPRLCRIAVKKNRYAQTKTYLFLVLAGLVRGDTGNFNGREDRAKGQGVARGENGKDHIQETKQ
jgi:hypothetical protein